MACEPGQPCAETPVRLAVVPPTPGERPLHRRIGEFHAFRSDLIARVERRQVHTGGQNTQVGRIWDIEGDPRGAMLADLWGFVAEGVAAYTELTAAEAYLATASDWDDLHRLAALVGYRPRPRVAAQGWIRVEIDPGTNPIVNAGTGVQAPGSPPQTFEVAADTQLHADWAQLTATWPLPSQPVAIPQPSTPTADQQIRSRQLRLLQNPGFGAGDRILFLAPKSPPSSFKPIAVAIVEGVVADLGTYLITFDRDLSALVAPPGKVVARRIVRTAGSARRLETVIRIPAGGNTVGANDELSLTYQNTIGVATSKSLVLDTFVNELSAEQELAIVDWGTSASCDIVPVHRHEPFNWQIAPGASTRQSLLTFAKTVPVLKNSGSKPLTTYVVGPEVKADHFPFPDHGSNTPAQVRIFPAPSQAPTYVAVQTDQDWHVVACTGSAIDAAQPPGLVLTVDELPAGNLVSPDKTRGPASGNLVLVRHGKSSRAVLGSGDTSQARQLMPIPDRPVAYDLDSSGNVVPTLSLQVAGIKWAEVETLYSTGDAQDYVAVLDAQGGITVRFGTRLPTGKGNVSAKYRVGGGMAGEVASGAITTLLGSIPGVKKVIGTGATFGGADQDDELRLRQLVPMRARSLGRVVSRADLVDLALAYPGVSHAAAWSGAGPSGCSCGGVGLHVAFLRWRSSGPGAPQDGEISTLAGYLASRRDPSVPLCVCSGVSSPLALSAAVAVDPRWNPTSVYLAAEATLSEDDGTLSARGRAMGEAFDESNAVAILQSVRGLLGVSLLSLLGGLLNPAQPTENFGRIPAQPYELLYLGPQPDVHGVQV